MEPQKKQNEEYNRLQLQQSAGADADADVLVPSWKPFLLHNSNRLV
jgi:hypothetical protein